eukprot:gnl/Spiro4/22201_TR10934_c0_g1_i1.p1 gnl/Spiro4/22201_TR10934_c0_g1~~gnl/Spiro4/22201_TR10934_c0_g1_i1.p1  ORF type:complete len:509 (-),score=98.19 gnl/Spiro4/22201_TR10934_c0_g1_i1:214-1740(-)
MLGRLCVRPARLAAASLRSFHACVVGSGPAGFYTAETLLRCASDMLNKDEEMRIDLYEKFPCPYGLVRSGVAPDHPEVKIVTKVFDGVAADKRVRFFGNVSVGTPQLSVQDLLAAYDAVVMSFGASGETYLKIPGEQLRGVYAARDFVGWYNNHFDHTKSSFDLTNSDTAVVVGQGNVALDVARVLLSPRSLLQPTDIADSALEALDKSTIRRVVVLGRRGPMQAAFTTKELRELLALDNVQTSVLSSQMQLSPADQEEAKSERARRRMFELLEKRASKFESFPGPLCASDKSKKQLWLIYNRSPVEIVAEDGRVSQLKCVVNSLEGPAGHQVARATNEMMTIDCGVIFRSIGYKCHAIDGLPFDSKKSIVPNVDGRVLPHAASDAAGADAAPLPIPGLYVSGWLKKGPNGIIATTKYDAEETAASILEDAKKKRRALPSSPDAVVAKLVQHGVRYVTFDDWRVIDAAELAAGQKLGKVREKFSNAAEMLRVLDQARGAQERQTDRDR